MKIKFTRVKEGSIFVDGKKYKTFKSSLGVLKSVNSSYKDAIYTIHIVQITTYKKFNSISNKRLTWKRKVHPGIKIDDVYWRYFLTL